MEVLSETSSKEYLFLQGGGEMGALIRSFDWSTTSLGNRDRWPQSLRTTLGLLLHSAFPMFLFWGEDLVCFYNDAFRPSLGAEGKHPAIGKKGQEVWPEIWAFIGPLIEQVWTTGEPVWFEDQLVPFYRNGRIEDIYWTFSYSPAYGENGKINGVFVTCTETTDKVLTRKMLEQSEQNLRNTILKAPVAMCILKGEQFVVEIANDRIVELWGKSRDEVSGKPLFEGVPEASNQGFEELLGNVLATGQSFSADSAPVRLGRQGKMETVYVNFLYEPYREPDGRVTGVIAVAIDVTSQVLARQKIEQLVSERTLELASANNQLQQSNYALSQFAYIASHDLKEPVRKVSAYTQMLEAHLTQPDDRTRNYIAKIKKSSAKMLALIRDVLAYSELSRLNESYQSTDLQQVIDELRNDFDLLIEQKNALIVAEKLPVIEAIPLHMSQLFGNLLSNALKFSKPDVPPQIRISSSLLSPEEKNRYALVGADNDYYRIEVRDNGIGFNPEYGQQIFAIFQRLHGNNEYEGTGIGLAMCHKIVQNHGGEIYATSMPGEGSCFGIILPARQARNINAPTGRDLPTS